MKKIESLTVLNGIEIELGVTKVFKVDFHENFYLIPVFINPNGMYFSSVDSEDGSILTYAKDHDWQLWEDPNEYWLPKKSEEYSHVDWKYGSIHSRIFDNDIVDINRINLGNLYKTIEQAEFARDKAYFVQKLRVWFHENKQGYDYKKSFDVFKCVLVFTACKQCIEKDVFEDVAYAEFSNELQKFCS